MADEAQKHPSTSHGPHVIRAIHWKEIFPFLHIFRAFRIAVHPSKLGLGLMALLLIYCGGRILDGLWPQKYQANYGEAAAYEEFSRTAGQKPGQFLSTIQADRTQNQATYAGLLVTAHIVPEAEKDAAAATFQHFDKLKQWVFETRNGAIIAADAALAAAIVEADKKTDSSVRDADKQRANVAHDAAVAKAFATVRGQIQALHALKPRGLFIEFFDYETRQVGRVIDGVFGSNWTSGVGAAEMERRPSNIAQAFAVAAPTNVENLANIFSHSYPDFAAAQFGTPSFGPARSVGVVAGVVNFFVTGPGWLLRYHSVFFILFTLVFLLVWAVFGGAIARIAAVHVARDERISVREAVRFSTDKLLSFIFAPVIPMGILLACGLAVAVGGLLFYIPWVGPVVGGAILVLGLLAGLVMTLCLIGGVGGVGLMYPTIAVEGSDSFDAISRSFSYVFTRPWKALFYTAVAIAYGAVCFVLVKLFIYLVLALTHYFVGLLLVGQPGLWYPEQWPAPTFDRLPYDVGWAGLKWSEAIAAFFISVWAFLTIGILGAFAISFYFSSNTIIYCLLRKDVDATPLDEVHVDEEDDELTDPEPVPASPDAPAGKGPAAPAGEPAAKTVSLPITEAAPPPAAPLGGEGFAPSA